MDQDLRHLRLLSISHYLMAGIAALTFYAPTKLLLTHPPRKIEGVVFAVMSGVPLLGFWILAVCTLLAGRNLARRRHHNFCLIVACLLCIFIPFGTVLGVLSIIVLLRPSVKALFEAQAAG